MTTGTRVPRRIGSGITAAARTLICLALAALPAVPSPGGREGPQISSIAPGSGVTTPGIVVEIYGSGFSPGAEAYIGGLEARRATFVSPYILRAVTPYLPPGTYPIQLKSGGAVLRSEATFTATPAPVDSEIDRAVALAAHGQQAAGLAILEEIATNYSDYQVRAFAHYEESKIYFAAGDWIRWAGQAMAIYADADKSGAAVQTSWRYGLAASRGLYLNPTTRAGFDLREANINVEHDVTENPEPRFFRGLIEARSGELRRAMADAAFVLKAQPSNPSYQALGTYIAALAGDATRLRALPYDYAPDDARALRLLGQAAYLSGDLRRAQQWWARAGELDPHGASLAYYEGRKELARGHRSVGRAILEECVAMAPRAKEAKEASELLAALPAGGQGAH